MAFMPYSLVRNILFRFDAETAHKLSLRGLNILYKLGLLPWLFGGRVFRPVKVMGINFPNRVGLAAGLDKDGDYFQALSACGFGFVEIGTVTPLPQPGNDKPRLFRLQPAQAIINRMGFNNKGVDNLLRNVKGANFEGVLGINIGKNKNTPEENAVDDYLICLRKVYEYADYITINISSPNTPGLRNLQFGETLRQLLEALKDQQQQLAREHERYVPLLVKVAPDMDDSAIESVAATFMEYAIDGVIVSNTTLSRDGVEGLENADQAGGLSGAPLKPKADHALQVMVAHLQGKIPVIAVGGISSAQDALDKIRLGASLVQIYTGFIYQGPALVHACARVL